MASEYNPANAQRAVNRITYSASLTEVLSILLGLCVALASAFLPKGYALIGGQQIDWVWIGLPLCGIIMLYGKVSAETQRGQAQLLLTQMRIAALLAQHDAVDAVAEPVA